MASSTDPVALRRTLHQYPEPFWREFHTTSILVDELERIGVDEIHIGPDALDLNARFGVPEESTIEEWRERAEAEGARTDVIAATADGATGVVGVLRCGDGPTIGLRVDIDGLYLNESTAEDHRPANEGFRSIHDGLMHACGHDASTAIGVGILDRLQSTSFNGTCIVFFQPASEIEGGGKAMASGPHIDDVEYLFVVNVGFDHPTGEVVAGVTKMYGIERFKAEFTGTSAHAAQSPETGRNAIQATATAITNLYGIPRHAGGPTRVNVGTIHTGGATNRIADHSIIQGEVRGETTALLESMQDRATRTLESAATMHECSVSWETIGRAPSADSDDDLAGFVHETTSDIEHVTSAIRTAEFGAGEDAAWLMNTVSDNGGRATHLLVGTDHPTGHHTPTFDIDDRSIQIGIDTIVTTALELADPSNNRTADELL